MRALATGIVLLALLPAAAVAKTGISLNPPPDGTTVGEPWDVTFEYIRNDAPVNPRGVTPSVRMVSQDGAISRTFPAHLTYKGLWSVRVYFPKPGVWTYSIQGFGRAAGKQSWDPVTIAPAVKQAPPVAASTTSSNGSSFPYGWAGGGAALVLLASGLGVLKLRSS
jgi:hypothetical protein